MLSKLVRQFFSQHLPQSPRVIVGLSGGADSMALLLSLKGAGVDIVAAHCNFHLRGAESERDREHCEQVCRKLGIKLLIKDFDVTARRVAASESVEMACRSLRYDWWNELIITGVGDYIAVGHHREDNVETFFLNLLRGSGISGLKGMLPVNGRIIRPLLEVSRAEIECYVTTSGHTWVNDSTNSENEYKRNRLRNMVVPMLEQEFPGATDAIVKSLSILRDNYGIYREAVAKAEADYVSADGTIDLDRIMSEELSPEALMHEILPPLGLTHSQVEDIYRCAKSTAGITVSGKVFETPNGCYILERGRLAKMPSTVIEEHMVDVTKPPFSATRMSVAEFRSEIQSNKPDANTIFLDARALDDSAEWTVRSWRNGDRLAPFGMKGTRLVSDIFTDAKYTTAKKNATPLLFRDGELLWVIGLRASRHFKVTADTKEVIKIVVDWNGNNH